VNTPSPGAVPTPPTAGIVCPRCKKPADWKIQETRRDRGRVLRIRVCKACQLRVRTREVIEAVCECSMPKPAA
jgi:hypothetical protein